MKSKYFADMVSAEPTKAVFSFNGVDKDVYFKKLPYKARVDIAADYSIEANGGKSDSNNKVSMTLDKHFASRATTLVAVTIDEQGNNVFESYDELVELSEDFVNALFECYEKATAKK